MKRITLLLLIFTLVFASNRAFAAKKKPFKGKVTYQISYDAKDLPEGAIEMMPKTMALYVGDNKTKTVLFTGMGKQSVVYDLTEKTKTAFMDIMGRKFAIKNSFEDIQKEFLKEPESRVEILDETKDIAGFLCKKNRVTLKDRSSGDTTINYAWFATDLIVNPEINFGDTFFNQIKGVLMEYQLDTGQGFMMNFVATEVVKEKVPAKEFEAPEGYVITTRENLMKILGGM